MLFDLDGVLLDSASAVRATLAGVATCATGRRVMPRDLPPGALRRPRVEVLALLDVADPDDACARWWDSAMAATPIAAFPGVLPGLQALRDRGAALGAVTLQDRDRLQWLLPPAVAELLDVVVTRHDAPPKPAPDGLTAALNRLDARPERAVFVGDSPTDMAAARAAGVLALGATWGFHPPAALLTAGADHLLPHPTSIGPSLLHYLPLIDSA
ncbi:HAD family hydrolase (plasmid) [Streptomyces sp. NBC_01525]|uniref:HAD family hydrolase n=1 Tax=Streptomyces sp. NBC_01525 TaxID=2903893 RepID=UPI002F907C90